MLELVMLIFVSGLLLGVYMSNRKEIDRLTKEITDELKKGDK